jgi:methionine-rich copper-binding protein CopC
MYRLRFVAVSALGISALLASTAVVSAHAQYQSSSPPANGTVSAAPNTVQVSWSEELSAIQFTITGPDGSNVVNGPATIDLAQRKNASVPVKSAGAGQYIVVWHNVSGDDGDPNDGSFVFTVAGTPAPVVAPTPAPTPAPGSPPVTAVKPPAPCVDDGKITPGMADFRVNTYCKRQTIREQYKGQIDEGIFNFDLSIGMGLESSLKDAMPHEAE